MIRAWDWARRFCWRWTRVVFWITVVTLTIQGGLHVLASMAPPHMRTTTTYFDDGSRIIREPSEGKSYYFPPGTPSGSTLKPVQDTARPENSKKPEQTSGGEIQYFTLSR